MGGGKLDWRNAAGIQYTKHVYKFKRIHDIDSLIEKYSQKELSHLQVYHVRAQVC